MSTLWERVARRTVGEDYASAYADRFARASARGDDIHGEADLVVSLRSAPAAVLDAGCGTGRSAQRLHALGFDVVGCDVDASMIEVARRDTPDLDWRVADLATLDLGRVFDVVLLAGNVVPFLEPGTMPAVCARVAAHVAAGGMAVIGFGTDAAHVPAGCPLVSLADLDAAMAATDLSTGERWSTWDRRAFDADQGYVVATYTAERA